MRSSADGAAAGKSAKAVACQISVASVSKPIGRRSSVAGSSFIELRKTSAAPARMPGRTSGAVIRASVRSWPRPRPRDASSKLGFTRPRAEPVAASDCGRKRTT